jgi:hypothetical protein
MPAPAAVEAAAALLRGPAAEAFAAMPFFDVLSAGQARTQRTLLHTHAVATRARCTLPRQRSVSQEPGAVLRHELGSGVRAHDPTSLCARRWWLSGRVWRPHRAPRRRCRGCRPSRPSPSSPRTAPRRWRATHATRCAAQLPAWHVFCIWAAGAGEGGHRPSDAALARPRRRHTRQLRCWCVASTGSGCAWATRVRRSRPARRCVWRCPQQGACSAPPSHRIMRTRLLPRTPCALPRRPCKRSPGASSDLPRLSHPPLTRARAHTFRRCLALQGGRRSSVGAA